MQITKQSVTPAPVETVTLVLSLDEASALSAALGAYSLDAVSASLSTLWDTLQHLGVESDAVVYSAAVKDMKVRHGR